MAPRRLAAHPVTDGLWDWNLQSDRVQFSPRWIALIGCQEHEVGNTPDEWFRRVHPDDSDQLLRELDAARLSDVDQFSVRYRLRHQDGAYRWMLCRATVVRNDSGGAIRLQGSQSDVTAETVTDSLTGLPNHLLFVSRLTQAIEQSRRHPGYNFAVLVLELRRSIGEEHRSVLGADDQVFLAAARRLESCLRMSTTEPGLRHDDLVARMQGDRFAVLLDDLQELGLARTVADHILMEMLAPFESGGRELHLSASIGIAVSATGYATAADVLRDAEAGLHRARVFGGSRAEVFDTAVLESRSAERQLESDLDRALERNEFVLRYEPIVSLSSNQIVGFEALVRWLHPVHGLISPLEFIPVAEKTGRILILGHQVLREACRQLHTWQNDFSKDLWMSVNVSSAQLRDPSFVDCVSEAAHSTDVDPHTLTLELTEGIAMENPAGVKTVLMQLRTFGVRISIDDFGTGYSSLAYLRQLPMDVLKIDRSFVRGMELHKDMADIVDSLTAMAQKLGLQVVAEGIENDEQLALLRSLRCDSGQGYLFARPLDADGATEYLRSGLPQRPASANHDPAALRTYVHRTLGVRKRLPTVAVTAAAVIVLSGGYAIVRSKRTDPPAPSARTAEAPADPGSVPITQKAPTAPASFRVQHQHRFGGCSGRLVISTEGVAFLPDDKSSHDGFRLAYRDLFDTLADDRLTITSKTRAYRFKSADSAKDNLSVLKTIVVSIERARAVASTTRVQ